jgi:hypothetical protein
VDPPFAPLARLRRARSRAHRGHRSQRFAPARRVGGGVAARVSSWFRGLQRRDARPKSPGVDAVPVRAQVGP